MKTLLLNSPADDTSLGRLVEADLRPAVIVSLLMTSFRISRPAPGR
jgi:hypothetical protein